MSLIQITNTAMEGSGISTRVCVAVGAGALGLVALYRRWSTVRAPARSFTKRAVPPAAAASA